MTFDDLPLLSPRPGAGEALQVTRRLTRALRACRIPATGFVTGQTFESRPQLRRRLLRVWVRAGFELGNHSYSHNSLNELEASAYIADIARDDALLRRISPRGPRQLWFRHPFLETGDTAEKRQAVDRWLAEHHYRVAPVTLEADDDVFASVYEDAVRSGDAKRAGEIRSAYLDFANERLKWYRRAAYDLLGRDPAFVWLLHASLLNADAMPDLCRLLRSDGLQPVPLAQALNDPAYRLPDGPPNADGDDWLNRWAGVLGRDLPWDSFPEPPAAIRDAAARLDPDSH